MIIRPKNWKSFQHYTDRQPPWIKLHKTLLDDYEFHCLPVASKALAPLLWLLASESTDGSINAGGDALSFRLRMSGSELEKALKPLIESKFFEVVQLASTPLAADKHFGASEREAETEREGASAPVKSPPKTSSARRAVPIPDDFTLSETMRSQALAKFPDCDPVEMFTQFRAHHESHGKAMKNWPAAWTTWIGNAAKFGYPKIKIPQRSSNGLPTLNLG